MKQQKSVRTCLDPITNGILQPLPIKSGDDRKNPGAPIGDLMTVKYLEKSFSSLCVHKPRFIYDICIVKKDRLISIKSPHFEEVVRIVIRDLDQVVIHKGKLTPGKIDHVTNAAL